MPAIGNCWAANSWDDDAWQINTWAEASPPAADEVVQLQTLMAIGSGAQSNP